MTTERAMRTTMEDRSTIVSAALAFFMVFALATGEATAQQASSAERPDDARVGLGAGWLDAEDAIWNLEHLAFLPRPEGFYDPNDIGSSAFAYTDMAFRGDHAFVGSYHGFNVYDVSDPRNPSLTLSVVCPGGQGDISVAGDLLFLSVQDARSRIDCGTEGTGDMVDPERFRGVRVFDISDLENPVQVATVQTCRGSHTHTVVTDPDNIDVVYVYVSGTSPSRPAAELEGCVEQRSPDHPETAYWSIAVIEVPVDAPETARVVNEPRVFEDDATGEIAGLWPGGDHGMGTQQTRATDHCHDITAYPEIGLAAGACAGNGILFDITNPADPIRIDEVVDPNFAYWHSATFNNDGTKVIFTDEWGGGTAPRCLESDDPTWGANAIFDVVNGRLELAGYYKMPAPQTATENCVAHNGSLIPVPGRDIKVQAWYQGGISVFDFTDSANPYEIAYFDRGPLSEGELMLGGYWSAYWYNGHIYGSEIARGFDAFALTPSEHLSQSEIDAARLVIFDEFNAQHQPRHGWPPSSVVAHAYLDQALRHGALAPDEAESILAELQAVESLDSGAEARAALADLATDLWGAARNAEVNARSDDAERLRTLAGAILDLATTME